MQQVVCFRFFFFVFFLSFNSFADGWRRSKDWRQSVGGAWSDSYGLRLAGSSRSLTLFSSLVGSEAYRGEVGSSDSGDGKAGEDGERVRGREEVQWSGLFEWLS